ncbi:hypothetical protein [Streptomyces sp. SID3343]|uniref:hypothetical protein n=1 Tax=Streptomyces sp. SID3343 TaxID=2690260 RepID=UPI00136F2630|nr:hypothetical protein [Streptomyces sp. SID3343]MYW03466.1 hypothetical protein [Streptomyces sp. SID3343]
MAYATVVDLAAAWPSEQLPLPADAARLLADASGVLDAAVLLTAVYDVDASGDPTDPAVTAAFAAATCALVRWWEEQGDDLGTSATVGSVSIGSVSLTRAAAGQATSGEDIPPRVWTLLRSPRLACRLRLGVVRNC